MSDKLRYGKTTFGELAAVHEYATAALALFGGVTVESLYSDRDELVATFKENSRRLKL